MSVNTLGDALPKEIERVQEIIAVYRTIPHGQFAAALMEQAIKTAHAAMVEGDTVKMIFAYESLKGYTL